LAAGLELGARPDHQQRDCAGDEDFAGAGMIQLSRFSEGAWLVELALVRDPEGVARTHSSGTRPSLRRRVDAGGAGWRTRVATMGGTRMATTDGLRYVDSDGHILEHPTAMPDYAPAEYRDRIWHIETDADGEEWLLYNGNRTPANGMSAAGVAGASDEDRARAFRGEMRYTETRPAAWNAKARLHDMDQDHIDLAVLYPTMLLALQSERDVDFAEVQARAYNEWCSDHVSEGEGRLFGAGAVPPMHEEEDVERVAAEIRRVATLPGMVSVFMRPNPAIDWRAFNDAVYDPIWQAAADTGLPIALHPFLAADLPGACIGLRLGRPRDAQGRYADDFDAEQPVTLEDASADPLQRPSVLFTQAIANPVDVMSCIAYLTAGGVCERFPDAKFIFLEANGGWLVPWLERLDHHCRKFQWEVEDLSMLPSDYMKRQCWISFDPDESMLAFTAQSPLVGADRIIWASDYPHPDAKFPGVTEELAEALEGLTFEQQQQITSESALALYNIGRQHPKKEHGRD
jgi:predicted TIM-barrel fold metal-dependent hydrolase